VRFINSLLMLSLLNNHRHANGGGLNPLCAPHTRKASFVN
jgi:hypothetical protein